MLGRRRKQIFIHFFSLLLYNVKPCDVLRHVNIAKTFLEDSIEIVASRVA